jgi:hypothetical protein
MPGGLEEYQKFLALQDSVIISVILTGSILTTILTFCQLQDTVKLEPNKQMHSYNRT